MDDDDLTCGVNDWFDYCKRMFRKVTKNDLIEFENKYKGSEEEKTDLKRIYLETAGDMDQIFERHLLACLEDEDRLRSIIDKMIEEKIVPPFDAYTKETKAKRTRRHKKVVKTFSFGSFPEYRFVVFQLTKEAAEAEKLMKELNIGNDQSSLERAIQMRQQERAGSNFYDRLLEKYGSKSKRSKKVQGKRAAKTDDEDDDDDEQEFDSGETLTDDEDDQTVRRTNSSKKRATTMKKTRRAPAGLKKRKVSSWKVSFFCQIEKRKENTSFNWK